MKNKNLRKAAVSALALTIAMAMPSISALPVCAASGVDFTACSTVTSGSGTSSNTENKNITETDKLFSMFSSTASLVGKAVASGAGQQTAALASTSAGAIGTDSTTHASVSLSLNDAIEKMTTDSKLSRDADNNRTSDLIAAKSNSESASNISSVLSSSDDSMGLTVSVYSIHDYNMAALGRTFISDHLDDNHEAEMNSIRQSTMKQYYTLLTDIQKIKNDETQIEYQQKMVSAAGVKLKNGLISNEAYNTQLTTLQNAEKTLAEDKISYKSHMRSFNQDFGYDLDTELVLTTPIEITTLEIPDQTSAVALALENNLEIKYYDEYYVEKTNLNLKSKRSTTSISSSSYRTAELQYNQAVQTASDKKIQLEQSIRTTYDTLATLKNNIASAEDSVATAQRNLTTAMAKLNTGLASAADVVQAQLSLQNSEMSRDSLIIQYNETVLSLISDTGVGSQRVMFN